jgi:hypothetical protein
LSVSKLKQEHALATGKGFAAVLNCLTPQGKEADRSDKAFAEEKCWGAQGSNQES